MSLLHCSFERAPLASFKDAFVVTNIPFGLDEHMKTSQVQSVYAKLEAFLSANFGEFREVYVINAVNNKPTNFLRRTGNGLRWESKFTFYSGGLELSVFQLLAVDWFPAEAPVGCGSKAGKAPSAKKPPTKADIIAKIDSAVKTGATLKLSKKERHLKKKFGIASKYDLERIDSLHAQSKASRLLLRKLQAKKRNLHLATQKQFETTKAERAFKKALQRDAQKVRLLHKTVQTLAEETQRPELAELWETMARPVLGGSPFQRTDPRRLDSSARDDVKRLPE